MPTWKYKQPKIFPIDRIPVSQKFVMRHAHLKASMMMLARHGVKLPRWPSDNKVELPLTYSDIKDFTERGVLEKEYKCADCHEVETYVFKLRRPGESRQVKIQEVITKEVVSDN